MRIIDWNSYLCSADLLLTHDELAERYWRGRLGTPETLAQRVLLLRRAVGDAAGRPRYLRGVRGLGCQLIPPVGMRRPPSSSISAAQPDGVAGLAGNIDLSLPAQPPIVVLPFDTDGDAEHRNVALGLTHDVMTRIARTQIGRAHV